MSLKKKKICQLVLGLPVGGTEVLACRLGQRLRGEFDFLFVCLDEIGSLGESLQKEGFRVVSLKRQPGIDWRCSLRLSRLIRQEKVDAVHAHQYTPFFYSMTARLFGSRVPVLFTEHGRFLPDHPRRKRMIFNRCFLRRKDRCVGVGNAVRQALIQNEGIPESRVGVIYNGIDMSPYQNGPPGADRALVRAELGLNDNDFVVAQVARLDYLKDHFTAIRAIERVARECDRVRLLLVGDGPERATIEAEIQKRGVSSHVRLVGIRSDVSRVLAASDAFLLTSISEGIPLTIIEAMCAGLPVVSTRVGGIPEIVEDEVTALLADAGDDEGLAHRLLRLAAAAQLREEMGQRGRVHAISHFSENRMHSEYAALYCEMLSG